MIYWWNLQICLLFDRLETISSHEKKIQNKFSIYKNGSVALFLIFSHRILKEIKNVHDYHKLGYLC